MNAPVFCTIVANNYLAYARVLASSLLEHHADARVVVLIVDPPDPGRERRDEPFETIAASELGLAGFHTRAFRYSVLELGTALKPTLLKHLHTRLGCAGAIYLDPDILVLGDLGDLWARLESSDLLLTPHLTAPIDDDAMPGERELLVAGVYNLGFLGLRYTPEALALLDWWERRLARQGRHAVERGLFVDQKWMDLAPALLDRVEVLRDPGLNMAYWNLPHRWLERQEDGAPGGIYRVGGSPLRFFHFSGFDAERPDRLSRFQNRFRLADRPDLAPLFADYGRRLAAAGHQRQKELPYGFCRYSDGTPIPELARRLFSETDPLGKRWPDPFDAGAADSFRAWSNRAGRGDALRLPRLALVAWDERGDLRASFPRLDGPDRPGFAAWALAHRELLGLSSAAVGALHEAITVRGRAEKLAADSSGPESGLALDAAEDDRSGSAARPYLPRLAFEILAERRDLREQHRDPRGADRRRLALWFVTCGRQEHDLPASAWRPVLRSLSTKDALWARFWWLRQRGRRLRDGWRARRDRPAETSPVPPDTGSEREVLGGVAGVNVIGWPSLTTGTAEACRSSLTALAEAGVPFALRDLGPWMAVAGSPGTGSEAWRDEHEGLPFEITLLHVNADMTEQAFSLLPRAATAGRTHVGYWFWELAHLPLEYASAFTSLDEVWVPTRFCADAIRPLAPIPVLRVPPCVPTPVAPPADRARLGVDPEAFLLLFAFDARSVAERKNPLGLLAAFAEACRLSPRPLALLLKSQHLDPACALAREIRRRSAGLPVTIVDTALERCGMQALLTACDAYVSLHRSEGLGLPLIETMLLGKPVVATGYGGVDDFLDERTGFVVPHRLVPLAERHGPYPPGAVWAEPDLASAAELMAEVAAGGAEVARRAASGRARVEALYSPSVAGSRFRVEFERLGRAEQAKPGLSATGTGR